MLEVSLTGNKGFRWYATGGRVFAKGYLHEQGRTLTAADLPEYFLCGSTKELEQRLRQANGNFALVHRFGSSVVAAVDRVRSIPLFYSMQPVGVFDNIEEFDLLRTLPWDEVAAAAFLRSGHTVGARTLVDGVSQLQAGQMLVAGEHELETHFYFRHYHSSQPIAYGEPPSEQLLAIADHVFGRLVESANGRQLVVPLSGGFDSRFIAVMLKRLEYENVLCFSYGRRDSVEVDTARRVASTLGIRWHYLEHSYESWGQYLSALDYHRYATSYCSLPNCPGYTPLKRLHEAGLCDPDAIFVPGFCGDLLGGSYIPQAVRHGTFLPSTSEELLTYVMGKHFSLQGTSAAPTALVDAVRHELGIRHGCDVHDARSFISNNEEFFTRHKVALVVVNSVREYEHFGYEWRLPLWDNELTDFWYQVSHANRVNSRMYNDFLQQSLFVPHNVAYDNKSVSDVRNRFVRGPVAEALYGFMRPVARRLGGYLLGRRYTDINDFDSLEQLLLPTIRSLPERPFANINTLLSIWTLERAKEWRAES